jgi:hypothetical protein
MRKHSVLPRTRLDRIIGGAQVGGKEERGRVQNTDLLRIEDEVEFPVRRRDAANRRTLRAFPQAELDRFSTLYGWSGAVSDFLLEKLHFSGNE